MSCSLYLIAPEGVDRPVKIGVADDPQKRLRQLQTGNPTPLRIVRTFSAQSRAAVNDWEFHAHRLFADHRLAGEWFDLSADDIIARVPEWRRRKPKPAPRAATLHDSGNFKPFHPVVPERLQLPISQLSAEERIEFWACFDLEPPPPGFDDWYIMGSASMGVMGAVPVEGWVNGEPA